MERRPLLVVALVPSEPMKEATVSTSGSCRDHVGDARCCRSIIFGNEMSGDASVTPMMRPGVLLGEEALGDR